MSDFASVEGVVEMTEVRSDGAPRGWLLIEVPHGATRRSDYDAVAGRLKSALPKDLDHFFSVNTDIGAPEVAARIAAELRAQGIATVIARCLMPRTFIDTNRVLAERPKDGKLIAGMTPAVPGYIDAPDDVVWLEDQHRRYHQVVRRAYEVLCGERGALALQMHTYAPKSVSIEKTDGSIVEALHAAYVPEVYAKWPERPPVDFICATEDGSFKAAPALVAKAKQAFSEAGVRAMENGTYHLHAVTMGYVYATKYPEQVLCVEVNRGLLADPFVPFGVSPISAEKVARMAAPLVRALSSPSS